MKEANLQAIIIAGVLSFIGALVIVLSAMYIPVTCPLSAIANGIAGSLLVAGIVGVIFEVVFKKAFFDEITAKAKLAAELKGSGIEAVHASYRDVNWEVMISRSNSLVLVGGGMRTWLNTHSKALTKFLSKSNSTLTVLLPDPNDDVQVREMSQRFNYTESDLKSRIAGTEKELLRIYESCKGKKSGTLTIKYMSKTPTYTAYAFQRDFIMTPYSLRKEKTDPVVFHLSGDSEQYKEFSKDVQVAIAESTFSPQSPNGNSN